MRIRLSFAKFVRRYFRYKGGIVGLIIFLVFAAFSFAPQYIAPFDPRADTSWFVGERLAPPIWTENTFLATTPQPGYGLLGTDQVGRDVFSEIVYGTRLTMLTTLLAVVVSVGLGLLVGLTSGYIGGKLDVLMMRIADIVLTIPVLALLIVLISVQGNYVLNLMIVVGLIWWSWGARLIRSQVLTIKTRTFVDAARIIGASRIRIIFRYILPNVTSLIASTSSLAVAYAIITQASISFLGLEEASSISWGAMLYFSVKFAAFNYGAWWLIVPPGLCLSLVVYATFLVGRTVDSVLSEEI